MAQAAARCTSAPGLRVPGDTRSDSHAWSAHPIYDLLTLVAGIEPASPGFATVRIAPHLGALPSLTAAYPHPRGNRSRSSTSAQGSGLDATVTLPGKLTGTFVFNGRSWPLKPGNKPHPSAIMSDRGKLSAERALENRSRKRETAVSRAAETCYNSNMAKGKLSTPPGHVNLRMLAEHLELSQTTVSLVLNNSPSAKSIPQETRNRVIEAAERLNYRPNYFARSLRQSRSMSVGVLAPDLSEGYFTRVMSGVVRGADRRALLLLHRLPRLEARADRAVSAHAGGARGRRISAAEHAGRPDRSAGAGGRHLRAQRG